MIQKLKNIPYWVYNVASLLSSIATILSAILPIFATVKVYRQSQKENVTININYLIFVLLVTTILFSLLLIVRLLKYGKLLNNIKYALAEEYNKFLKDFCKSYFVILTNYKKYKTSDSAIRTKMLTTNTKEFIENSLNYLCEVMYANTGEKVCACIKLIENNGSVNDINKETARVITFSRSSNNDDKRKTYSDNGKSFRIKENTDFYDILDENSQNTDSFFYQSDLQQYEKKLEDVGKEYRNTTRNYSKYYKSTIVVPIKIENNLIHYTEDDYGYNIIGFLCVDSLSTNAFRDTEFDKCVNTRILESFASELYIILNKYKYYLEKITEGGRNETAV